MCGMKITNFKYACKCEEKKKEYFPCTEMEKLSAKCQTKENAILLHSDKILEITKEIKEECSSCEHKPGQPGQPGPSSTAN